MIVFAVNEERMDGEGSTYGMSLRTGSDIPVHPYTNIYDIRDLPDICDTRSHLLL